MTVQRFPSPAMYVDALQNTSICLGDPDLKGASPRLDKLGRPRAISGAFASVFALRTAAGKRYALKCFTRDVPDQDIRYAAISSHLAGLSCPWQVGFDYLDPGILVDGTWYPVVKMEWVDAVGLTQWIDAHLHDSVALAGLAGRFVTLVQELSAANIGHGDFQHGNLLVTADGSLRLVDYDGMYVPALAGMRASEQGHRNYQLPTRSDTDFGPTVDRFSSWVVYLSLVSLALDPSLWRLLREDGAEHLLLAGEDFDNPAASFRFSTLLSHPRDEIRALAAQVHDQLTKPDRNPPALTAVIIDQPSRSGLPSWLVDHVTPSVVPAPRRFAQPAAAFRAVGWTSITLAAVVLVLGVAGLVAGEFAVVGMFMSLTSLAGSGAVAYRQRPEIGPASTVRKKRAALESELAAATKRVSQLGTELKRTDQENEEFSSKYAQRRRDLKKHYDQELLSLQNSARQQLKEINSQMGRTTSEQATEARARLAKIREYHKVTYLASFRVSDANLPGIGPFVANRLREAGIVSAADVLSVRYEVNRQYNTRTPWFRLRSGAVVRVQGFDEAKAKILLAWCRKHMKSAVQTQPRTLSKEVENELANRYSERRLELHAEREKINQEIAVKQAEVTSSLNSARAALDADLTRFNVAIANVRTQRTMILQQANSHVLELQRRLQMISMDADAHQEITYLRFLRFALLGK
ncbi:hypothetical protein [Actinocrispum wychmicini]|uniref:Protein kinase domain-containing protein n=1 Tax=Actinocrispum wychmicini TaxID=1213861 RepID=A0A4R2ILB0_9PSEU|nr:hypothetical protein [Actinocrispum wychmicini]TCO44689.1 hypothetical protein EV192_12310 [Actinocrispum wychmicini]